MWKTYALLSAAFAGATTIFAKIGMKGIDSNLATAIRSIIILILAWLVVIYTGAQRQLPQLTQQNWIFLLLSGIVTGLSWIFYFKAIQLGDVSKVAPIDKSSVAIAMLFAFIFLGEKMSLKALIGGILIVGGTFVLIL